MKLEDKDIKKIKDGILQEFNNKIGYIEYLNGIVQGLLIAHSFTNLITEIDGKPVTGDAETTRKMIYAEISNMNNKIKEFNERH